MCILCILCILSCCLIYYHLFSRDDPKPFGYLLADNQMVILSVLHNNGEEDELYFHFLRADIKSLQFN